MLKVVFAAFAFLVAAVVLVLVISTTADPDPQRNGSGATWPKSPRPISTTADPNAQPAPNTDDPRVSDMQWIPGGRFEMGALNNVPDEFPPHVVALDGFWMDTTEVTNRQFKEFVDATGYVTTAERAPELRSLRPDSELANVQILPEFNKPGSICSLQLSSRDGCDPRNARRNGVNWYL